MFGSIGLVIASSTLQVAAEPSSIRINVVAEVPVTCSTGAILTAQATTSGLRAALAGSCNADHVVRVTLVDASKVRSAQLNGQLGEREADTFRFSRPAYFASVSTFDVEVSDFSSDLAWSGNQIVVEISPV